MAVDALVEDHYEPFNSSVDGFSKIFDAYADSQNRVTALREQIQHCRGLLSERKQGLRDTLTDKLKTEAILVILKKISSLIDAPAKYDELVAQKKYEAAVAYVSEVQDMMFGEDLLNIGALSDLQRSWPNKKYELSVLLVDQLTHLIYTKPAVSEVTSVNASGTEEVTEEDKHRETIATIIRSLYALGQLNSALREVYSVTRNSLTKVVEDHKSEIKAKQEADKISKAADDKKKDGGVNHSMSGELGDSMTLLKLLHNILSSFKVILNNHIVVLQVTKEVCKTGEAMTAYTIEDVWTSIQYDITAFLAVQLQAVIPGSSTFDVKKESSSAHVTGHDKERRGSGEKDKPKGKKNIQLTFHFSDSAAWTIPADLGAEEKEKKWVPCVPSPYQIVIVYTPCWTFLREANRALTDSELLRKSKESMPIMKVFFSTFIQNTLVPRLTQDIHERTSEILGGADAFMSTKRILTSKSALIPRNVVLVSSCVEIYGIISEMIGNILALPTYVQDFIPVLEMQLERYIGACMESLRIAVEGSHTATRFDKAGAKVWNAVKTLLSSQKIFSQLIKNELGIENTSSIVGTSSEESSLTMESYEFDLRAGVPDPPFDNELSTLISPYTIGLICHLFESVRFVSDVIRALSAGNVEAYTLVLPSAFHTQETGPGSDKGDITDGKGGTSSPKKRTATHVNNPQSSHHVKKLSLRSRLLPTLQHMREVGLGQTNSRTTTPSTSPRSRSNVSNIANDDNAQTLLAAKPHLVQLSRIADRYDSSSFRMLFILKMEIRIVCYAHILGMLKSSYAVDSEGDDAIEPDGFLHELHAHLLSIDQTLSVSFSPALRVYIYQGIQDLLPDLLMNGLKHLFYRKVSVHGVERLCRNVAAIQQTLTSIEMKEYIDAAKCDRTRNYFRLLLCSEQELSNFIKEHPKDYTMEELSCIWNIEGPYRKATNESAKAFEKLYQSTNSALNSQSISSSPAPAAPSRATPSPVPPPASTQANRSSPATFK